MPFLSIPLFSLSRISSWVVQTLNGTQLEIREREKRGIERKGNFIIHLRCYKLFHCTFTGNITLRKFTVPWL